jgi:MFS family permease
VVLAFAGFGGGNCQMAAFALSELLPNKWRHIGVVLADAAVLVAVILAPVSARYGWEYGTWQWNFYTGAILQGLSFIGLFTLYFPPAHPYNLEPKQVIKKLDYLGKEMPSPVKS